MDVKQKSRTARKGILIIIENAVGRPPPARSCYSFGSSRRVILPTLFSLISRPTISDLSVRHVGSFLPVCASSKKIGCDGIIFQRIRLRNEASMRRSPCEEASCYLAESSQHY